jgi:Protein of unknown function (DUF3307)
MSELIAHGVGDYIFQSDWMALEKTKASWPAAAHALSYALPFVLVTRDLRRLAVIAGTHFVIDRWRLARYVVWAKNQLAPAHYRYVMPATGSGYSAERDATQQWMTYWLLIIADNTIHLACNRLALTRGGTA